MEEETAIQPITPETPEPPDLAALPMLLGLGEYQPTVKQAQAVYLFLYQTDNRPIHRIVGDITYDSSLWYKWKKTPGFLKWFEKICHNSFTHEKLMDVHAAVYRRALGNSPADSKLFLQRFDSEYTERQQVDQRHSFAGYEPQGPARSEERQRKALVDHALGEPEGALDAGDGPIDAITGDAHVGADTPTTPAIEATTGGAPPSPPSTPAIQAHSPCNTQEPEPCSHDDNDDDTPNSKPITPIDGAGGGL